MTKENVNELVITRVLDAPIDLVFKTITQAEHLAHWWGPKGLKLNVLQLELRVGGVFHYGMEAENGQKMWGKFVYREINPPSSITFVNSFADEQGNTIRAPFSPAWPLEILNVWTFTEQDGKTLLTLHGRPINATNEEIELFESMKTSMQQGFGGTFDQLTEYLTKISN